MKTINTAKHMLFFISQIVFFGFGIKVGFYLVTKLSLIKLTFLSPLPLNIIPYLAFGFSTIILWYFISTHRDYQELENKKYFSWFGIKRNLQWFFMGIVLSVAFQSLPLALSHLLYILGN